MHRRHGDAVTTSTLTRKPHTVCWFLTWRNTIDRPQWTSTGAAGSLWPGWLTRDIRKVRKRQHQYPEFGHGTLIDCTFHQSKDHEFHVINSELRNNLTHVFFFLLLTVRMKKDASKLSFKSSEFVARKYTLLLLPLPPTKTLLFYWLCFVSKPLWIARNKQNSDAQFSTKSDSDFIMNR
jgi:hypothetical protein